MNYRYRIDGEDVIVSGEEHAKILEGAKNKVNLVILRGGKLGISPAFIRKMTETETLTDEQEESRRKTLRLEAAAYQPPTAKELERRQKMHEEYRKSHPDWNWEK
jgi:hypothetical protein